ncbi:MAG: DUF2334 domain-containing protein [Armatimonadia bacterium]
MLAIFTNDDAGVSTDPQAVAGFRQVIDWLNEVGVRGTFFWVPRPAQYAEAHELWRDTLLWARDLGHDFQLHGLTHGSCLEFGLPQPSTRRANPRPFEEYEANRERYEEAHSAARLTERLRQGCEAYESLFGERPLVFRAPCFGVCANLYHALADVGISCSSSRGVNPTMTAYTLTGDESLHRWQPDYPCVPWIEPPGVVEIPCMEDYIIGTLPPEQYQERLALFKSEYSNFMEQAGEEGVIIFGSHYRAMTASWDSVRRLYEELLAWFAEQRVEWLTLKEYILARA